MSDEVESSYTETSTQGWFSRMANSFVGVLFGILFFLGSFVLLFWNEGRAVKRARDLAEGAKAVITVDAAQLSPANEGKLVHMTGEARTDETLADQEFGVSAKALRLKREVEMYQWDEEKKTRTKKNAGGSESKTTEYSYRKIWSERVINSGSFRHSSEHPNPKSKPFPSNSFSAEKITVGAFTLSPGLAQQIDNFQSLAMSAESLAKVPPGVRDRLKVSGSQFYVGNDPANPQIGDARIEFKAAPQGPVSLVARQKGNTFEPYRTSAGNPLEFLYTGTHTAQAIFEKEVTKNTIFTWVLRIVGAVVMWLGLMLIAGPLTTFADVIPLMGNLLGAGIGLFAALVSLALSLVTISIAWIVYRPLLGAALLAGALVLIYLLRSMGAKRRAVQRPPGAPPPSAPLPPLPPVPSA